MAHSPGNASLMKARFVIPAVLLAAVLGFGVGLKVGRDRAVAQGAAHATAGNPLAPSNPGASTNSANAGADATNPFLSLAEMERELAAIASLPTDDYWLRLRVLVRTIDPADIPGVLEKLSALPVWSKGPLRDLLWQRWGATNPRAAMDHANAIKDANERRLAAIQVLRGWLELDPASAVAWAKQLPPGQLQSEAFAVVAPQLVAKDPEAALALLEPAFGRGSSYSVRELFEAWSARDPAAAAARAIQMKNWLARQAAYEVIARNWSARDLPAALAWGQSLPDLRDRASVIGNMMGAWTTSAPQAAADYALSQLGNVRETLLGKVATVWAQKDLNAAVAWMKQLPGDDQSAVLQNIKFHWTANDPASAAAYGVSLPAGSIQNNFLNQVGLGWGMTNPKAAVEWLAQVPEGDARFSAINGIAAGWAETAPKDAAGFVASLPAGKTQDAAARNVLFRWQSADPGSAANWLAQFPEGDLRRDAMESLMVNWVRNDPSAAGRFLENLPAGKSREAAILTYVNQASAQSPELAAPFVNQVGDDNQRYSSAQAVAKHFERSDPAGYAKWLATLNLPEEKLKSLAK